MRVLSEPTSGASSINRIIFKKSTSHPPPIPGGLGEQLYACIQRLFTATRSKRQVSPGSFSRRRSIDREPFLPASAWFFIGKPAGFPLTEPPSLKSRPHSKFRVSKDCLGVCWHPLLAPATPWSTSTFWLGSINARTSHALSSEPHSSSLMLYVSFQIKSASLLLHSSHITPIPRQDCAYFLFLFII